MFGTGCQPEQNIVTYGEHYPASFTPWGSQFVTEAREMSLQSAAALYIYIHYALKKRNSGGGGKHNCTQTEKFTVVQVY
jgi:hypothetical protein